MHKLKLYIYSNVQWHSDKAQFSTAHCNTGLSIFTHHRGSHCEIAQTMTYKDISVSCIKLIKDSNKVKESLHHN